MESNFEYILSIFSIARGIGTTLKYTFFSGLFGLIFGFIIFLLTQSKNNAFKIIANGYISIFRGTPLILQLSIIYFGLPQILNINFSTFMSIVLAFGLNSSAYISEIFRSGFNSISIGQIEACKILNIDQKSQYRDIILPQIFKNMLPTFMNELSSLTKETAIISIIGELDIMRYANLISVEYYTYFAPMMFAGLCYFLIIKIISFLGKRIEKKLAYDSN